MIPGSEISPGRGNGNLLQCSCLENPMDRGTWRATFHGVAKSRTQLSNSNTHTHTPLPPQASRLSPNSWLTESHLRGITYQTRILQDEAPWGACYLTHHTAPVRVQNVRRPKSTDQVLPEFGSPLQPSVLKFKGTPLNTATRVIKGVAAFL